MGRSVVLKPSRRCERCQLPPRWCVCAAHREIPCALAVDVLVHKREQWRPSSTGNLIARTLAGARRHIWTRQTPRAREAVQRDEREVWILHPNGEPLPSAASPERTQVVLIDGSWRESLEMTRSIASWGRTVSLPMTGESRYWLRTQQEGARFSTVEALLFLLRAMGLEETRAALEAQFELHVYASLRSRGALERAQEFLETSPIRAAFPEVIEQLHTRRPLETEQ